MAGLHWRGGLHRKLLSVGTVHAANPVDKAGCVAKGTMHALVIADMPFGSFQESPAEAFRN